jgi:hypothetical protein
LRQEFIADGPIRADGFNIPYSEAPPVMTYSSQVLGELSPPAGVGLTALDKNTKVENLKNGKYEWTLSNLESDRKNRRYIKVSIDGKDFVGAHDVFRGMGKEFSMHFNVLKSADLDWLHWFSSKWGYQLNWNQTLFKSSSGEATLSGQSLRALYRLNPGIYLKEKTWYLGFGLDPFQLENTSIIAYGFSVGLYDLAPKWAPLFDRSDFRFDYVLGGGTDAAKVVSAYRFQYQIKTEVKKNQFMSVGARLDMTKVSVASADSSLNWPQLTVGYSYLF